MLLNNVNLPIIRMPSSPKTVNFSPLPSSEKQTPQNRIPKSPLSLLQKRIRVLNADNSAKSNKRFSQELGRAMPDQSQSEYFRDHPSKYHHKTVVGLSSPKNSKSHFADQSQEISRTNSIKKGNPGADIPSFRKENSSRSVKGLPKPINIDGPKSGRSSIKKSEVSPGLSSRKINISKLSGSQSSSPDSSPLASKAKRLEHGKSQFGKGRDDGNSLRKGSSRRLLLGKNKYLLGNIIRRKSCHCSDCGGISAFEKKHLNIAIPPKRSSRFKDHLLIGLRKLSRFVGSSPSDMSSNSKRSSNRTNSHMDGPDAVLENTLEKHESKSSSFKPEYGRQQSHSRETSKKSIGSVPKIKERVTIKDDHHLKKLIESFQMRSSKDFKGKSLDLKEKANTHINLDKLISSSSEEASSEDEEDHSLDSLSVRSSSKHEKKSSEVTGAASKTSNSSLKEKKKSSPQSKKSEVLIESYGKIESSKKKNEKYFESLTVMKKITESKSPALDLGASGLLQKDENQTILEKSQSLKAKVIHRNPVKVLKKRDQLIQNTYRQEERSTSIEKKPTRMTTSFTSPIRKIRPRLKKVQEQEPRLSSPVTHSCLNLKTARLRALEITTTEQQNMMSLTMRSPTSGKKSILDVERLYISPAAKKLSAMKIKLGNIVMKKPLESITSRVMQTAEEGNQTKRQVTEEGSRTKRNQENFENKKRIVEKKSSEEKPSASKNLNGKILEKLKTDKMMLLDIERIMDAYDSPVKSSSHIWKKASTEKEI